MNPYITLAKLMLPEEISESFDLVKVEEKKEGGEKLLHLYLDEFEIPLLDNVLRCVFHYKMSGNKGKKQIDFLEVIISLR